MTEPKKVNGSTEVDTLIIYKEDALREAFEAGMKYAMADPSNYREVFEAGEKKGSNWLNEASESKNFTEFMRGRIEQSDGNFKAWCGKNRKRLSTVISSTDYDFMDSKSKKYHRGGRVISIGAIERACVYVFGVSLRDLREKDTRAEYIKKPRFYAWYLAYHHCHASLESIGKHFANRGHATVLHGAKCTANFADRYHDDREILKHLYTWLNNHGYDIYNFVDRRYKYVRPGTNREPIKRIDIKL